MKRILCLLLIGILVCTMAGCGRKDELLGTWIYDAAEDPDPDMVGVKIEFEENTFLMTNSNTEDVEGSLECDYTKTDDVILVTETRILSDGKVVDSDSEFMEIPYSINGKKMFFDLTEVGIGKIILKKDN